MPPRYVLGSDFFYKVSFEKHPSGQCVSVSDGNGFYHDGHAGLDVMQKNFTHLANLVASVM